MAAPMPEGAPSASGAPAPVAGILNKWVNMLKGYQPRYFVLADGAFFYHKARVFVRPACGVPRCLARVRGPADGVRPRFPRRGRCWARIAARCCTTSCGPAARSRAR